MKVFILILKQCKSAVCVSCNGERELGIFHFQDNFKLKCHFHFLIHWILLKSLRKSWGKITKMSIFQTLNAIWGCCYKNAFSKMLLTFRWHLILWQHPQQAFYNLDFKKIYFGNQLFSLFFGCFYKTYAKW